MVPSISKPCNALVNYELLDKAAQESRSRSLGMLGPRIQRVVEAEEQGVSGKAGRSSEDRDQDQKVSACPRARVISSSSAELSLYS